MLRLALMQINAVVGGVEANLAKIKEGLNQVKQHNPDIVVFPELCLPGYPPEDLLFKLSFIQSCEEALNDLTAFSLNIKAVLVVGTVVKTEAGLGNVAAVLYQGQKIAQYFKVFLPNYGVFDEKRYFVPGQEALVLKVGNYNVGVSVCEDIWYAEGPPAVAAVKGNAQLSININASPYHLNKGQQRENLLITRAKDNLMAVAYVNLVGGQDELVFDGQSLVVNARGQLLARAAQFQEEFLLCDLDLNEVAELRQRHSRWAELKKVLTSDLAVKKVTVAGFAVKKKNQELAGSIKPPLSEEAEVWQALVLGTRDYVRKNNFKQVAIGLSGGIDSALTAAVAVEALGVKNVNTVFMPSRYTTKESFEDAQQVAANLGTKLTVINIDPIFTAYLEQLQPQFKDLPLDVAEENIQARIRGNLLMALANKFGWLVLSTGNKSEMSVGYTTLYGDMAGGFSVLKDVPKTLVYRLAKHLNQQAKKAIIPERVLVKPPSAELRPEQKDVDSLPPYELLDPIMQAYVEANRSVKEIVALGFEPALVKRVVKMIDKAEYKRRQAPPGVKITSRAFGKDWRVPITNKWQE